jgi:hypothetical protein
VNYLPRLAPEFYRGDAVVHWTLPIAHREKGWLNETASPALRELLMHACVREQLVCPCYCFMPDHMHFTLDGVNGGKRPAPGHGFLSNPQ